MTLYCLILSSQRLRGAIRIVPAAAVVMVDQTGEEASQNDGLRVEMLRDRILLPVRLKYVWMSMSNNPFYIIMRGILER